MRVAAILGLGSSTKQLHPFARNSDASWQLGLPGQASAADAILIFGGDGTVHRHLAQLSKLQLPVLVVPCGSGNDFARALKLRRVRDSVDAWRRFVSGEENVHQIDLGVISQPRPENKNGALTRPPTVSHYFCCVGGVGLDVEITRRANRLPRWIRGHGGYSLSLLPALLGFEPPALRVHADSSGTVVACHDGPAMVAAFANAPAYGGGIKIAPRARLDDGKLDVCIVTNLAKTRLLRLFPSVYSGGHLRIPEVKYFQTERVRVETETPSEVYADGEYVCRTPVEVWVKPAALKVIVGQGF